MEDYIVTALTNMIYELNDFKNKINSIIKTAENILETQRGPYEPEYNPDAYLESEVFRYD